MSDELWRDDDEPYGDPKPVDELRGKTIASAQRENYISAERLVIRFSDGSGLTVESFTGYEDSELRIRVDPAPCAQCGGTPDHPASDPVNGPSVPCCDPIHREGR